MNKTTIFSIAFGVVFAAAMITWFVSVFIGSNNYINSTTKPADKAKSNTDSSPTQLNQGGWSGIGYSGGPKVSPI
ncbi:MAG: hypothetical protein CBD97_01955 [Pelagibacteraceae bacterium TMED237]|nr:MAG: hypothetical protein CBD97_01955 [Pelagibacteraceae bacterium TMED237]|tara:strand:- start:3363 stop:3587 length:225 start_codon:yes stop_codon:yes gene_type:complete